MIQLHYDYNTIRYPYLIIILSGTFNPILETQNIYWHIQNSTIIQNISCEHILNEDSMLNMCRIGNAFANIMWIVCVKGWGCVKDQSETVVISWAQRDHMKWEMAPFLDSGCQKYGRPLGPHNMWTQINISWKGDGPELLGSRWLDLWK